MDELRKGARAVAMAGIIWLLWRLSQHLPSGVIPSPVGPTKKENGERKNPDPPKGKPEPDPKAPPKPHPSEVRWFKSGELSRDDNTMQVGDAAIKSMVAPTAPGRTKQEIEGNLGKLATAIRTTIYGATGQQVTAVVLARNPRTTAMFPGGPKTHTVEYQVQIRHAQSADVGQLFRLAERAMGKVIVGGGTNGPGVVDWWAEGLYSGVIRLQPAPIRSGA